MLSLRQERNAILSVQFATQIALWRVLTSKLGWKLTHPTSQTSFSKKRQPHTLLTQAIACSQEATNRDLDTFPAQPLQHIIYKELAQELVAKSWAASFSYLHTKKPWCECLSWIQVLLVPWVWIFSWLSVPPTVGWNLRTICFSSSVSTLMNFLIMHTPLVCLCTIAIWILHTRARGRQKLMDGDKGVVYHLPEQTDICIERMKLQGSLTY